MKRMIAWLQHSAGLRALALLTIITSSLFAADLNVGGQGLIATEGSGASTITSIVFNPDGTISIVATQEGQLSHLGKFTGSFAYLATIDPNTGTTFISGNGYFTMLTGDRINFAITIIEVGLDYPHPYAGGLTVTGGTGRFAGARGLLEINGIDDVSFTDPFKLAGVILTRSS